MAIMVWPRNEDSPIRDAGIVGCLVATVFAAVGCVGASENPSRAEGQNAEQHSSIAKDGGVSRRDAGASQVDGTTARSDGARPAMSSLRIPIPRNGKTAAFVHTLPHAACTFRSSEQQTTPASDIIVISDDDGIARMYLQHATPGNEHTQLWMDCHDDLGNQATNRIDIDVDDTAVEQAPLPFSKDGKTTLPVLTGDPMSYDVRDLRRRGYPPRPDPAKAPEAYGTWERLVTSGPALVEDHRYSAPRSAGVCVSVGTPKQSNNWAGVAIVTPAPTVGAVVGELLAPSTLEFVDAGPGVATTDAGSEQAGLWVGIGGFRREDGGPTDGGIPTLVQDGISFAIWNIGGTNLISYQAWTELVNTTIIEPAQYLSYDTLPVNPGETVYAAAWVENTTASTNANWPTDGFNGPESWSATSYAASLSVSTGDVNGDGYADALMFDNSTIEVMLSIGSGVDDFSSQTNWQPSTVSSFDGEYGEFVADFNGDGLADVAEVTGTAINVMLSTGLVPSGGEGGFGPLMQWLTYSAPPGGCVFWATGDVNGDNRSDMICMGSSGPSTLTPYVMTAQSNNTFSAPGPPWTSVQLGGQTDWAFYIGDVNGDGRADLIMIYPEDGYYAVVQLSTGSAFSATVVYSGTSSLPMGSTVLGPGDVNGDGLADLVAFDGTNYEVQLATGTGLFAPWAVWLADGAYGGYAALGDFNGDGAQDIVTPYSTGSGTNVMKALPNTGSWSDGEVAHFFLWNETENVAAIPAPTPWYFSLASNQAEWILENVHGAVPPTTIPTPNFGTALISGAYAQDLSGGVHGPTTDTVYGLTMTPPSQPTEACVSAVSFSTVSIAWQSGL